MSRCYLSKVARLGKRGHVIIKIKNWQSLPFITREIDGCTEEWKYVTRYAHLHKSIERLKCEMPCVLNHS